MQVELCLDGAVAQAPNGVMSTEPKVSLVTPDGEPLQVSANMVTLDYAIKNNEPQVSTDVMKNESQVSENMVVPDGAIKNEPQVSANPDGAIKNEPQVSADMPEVSPALEEADGDKKNSKMIVGEGTEAPVLSRVFCKSTIHANMMS